MFIRACGIEHITNGRMCDSSYKAHRNEQ